MPAMLATTTTNEAGEGISNQKENQFHTMTHSVGRTVRYACGLLVRYFSVLGFLFRS